MHLHLLWQILILWEGQVPPSDEGFSNAHATDFLWTLGKFSCEKMSPIVTFPCSWRPDSTVNQLFYLPPHLPTHLQAWSKSCWLAERLELREVEQLGQALGMEEPRVVWGERSSENWGTKERAWFRANCWGGAEDESKSEWRIWSLRGIQGLSRPHTGGL